MSDATPPPGSPGAAPASGSRSVLHRLRKRGVIRVAASYAVIAWLSLQIADVTFEPMGAPRWAMRALITMALVGFPLAIALAWYFNLTPRGIERHSGEGTATRPSAYGARRYADVAIIATLALTVAFLLLRDSDWLDRDVALPEASIAILPFANVGKDADDEYLAVGLGDELRDQLSRVPSLRVISRSSSHAVQELSLAAPEAAGRLGVAALVEGTVRRDGKRLRVSAQLVDGRDGSVLWSSDYARATDDLLEVQADIARAIVAAVLPQFVAQGGQVPATSTSVFSAQDLYLLGRHLEREETPEARTKARALYEQAIAADPGYAAAHAALGRVIAFDNSDMAEHDPKGLDRLVLPHLDRALALDRALSDAYLVKGYLRRWSLRPGGDEFYRLAAELDPNNSAAHESLAAYYFAQNRPDLSLEHSLRARDLDPLRFGRHEKVISNLFVLGRLEEMQRAVTRMNDLFESDPRAAALDCQVRSANGAHDEVLACALLALRRFPEDLGLTWVAVQACFDLDDRACLTRHLQRGADLGDEAAALWLRVERGDSAAIERIVRAALAEPIDYGRGELLGSIALEVGLDELALDVFEAAGVERATTENSVLRRSAMVLLPQILLLRGLAGRVPDDTHQFDALVEWTSRSLAHGGQDYRSHLDRSEALTAAGRIDEAVAEIGAAAEAVGAPFGTRIVTELPTGRVLLRDSRLPALLKAIHDRQATLRKRLPATLRAHGLDPSEFTAIKADAADTAIAAH